MDLEIEFTKGSLILLAIFLVSIGVYAAVSPTMMGHSTIYTDSIKGSTVADHEITIDGIGIKDYFSVPQGFCIFSPSATSCPDGYYDWNDASFNPRGVPNEYFGRTIRSIGKDTSIGDLGGSNTFAFDKEENCHDKSDGGVYANDGGSATLWPSFKVVKVCCRK